MKNKLEQQILQFVQFQKDNDQLNVDVSMSTVGWHIDHCLKVVNGIIGVLQKSDPAAYKKKFNFKRFVVLLRGAIPRGVAKAPKTVQTNDVIVLEHLVQQTNTALKSVQILDMLNPLSNFQHPYFGQLNLKQAIRFIEIHNNHHLKIIEDILKE